MTPIPGQTTMEEIFRCSLPIIYEHPDEDFTYSRGATCYLATYKGGLFAITANHAIKNNDSPVESVRILAGQGVQIFLPLLGMTYSRTDDSHGDIAIVHINLNAIEHTARSKLHFLDLNLYNRDNTFSVDLSVLCLRGYPDAYYPFNYERQEMTFTGYYTEARYGGSTHAYCHSLEYLAPLDFEPASGLSGSPVMHAVRTGSDVLGLDFAGMLITSGNTRGHFIDSSAVYEALDAAIAQAGVNGCDHE